MDLAQKANRAKRDLQSAVHKTDATSLRHALESFDAFADAVVEEITALKALNKTASPETSESSPATDQASETAAQEQHAEPELATQ